MKLKNAAFYLFILELLIAGVLLSCAQPSEIIVERKAIFIGISDYLYLPDPGPASGRDLRYPDDDAKDLANLLESQGWEVNRKLINPEYGDLAPGAVPARKATIRAEIMSWFQDLEKNGIAMIYFSGHGTEESGITYLVAADYSAGSTSAFISATELSTWIIESIPANVTQNVIVIADSCYSGGFVSARESSDVISQSYTPYGTNSSVSTLAALGQFGDLLAANAAEKGVLAPIVISAAGSAELSYEDYSSDSQYYLGYANGVFTEFLLEAAVNGDANGDNLITCTEAYTYAAKAIDDKWNRTSGSSTAFYPHISGGLRDLVLFTK